MQVVIVEDEPVIAERLERQISQILGEKLGKIIWFDDLDDAQEHLAEHSIDLLFLDLNLHGDDGFDLLKTVTADSFHTIIVSAHADQAIKAFEIGVLDFVAKPFTQERLEQAINRMLNQEQRADYGSRFLSIKKAGLIELVAVKDIDYIVASGHYSELVYGEQTALHDKSIERIAVLLPPNFERIHRSYIANMNNIARLVIEPGSKYSVILQSGSSLPVGRTRFAKIKEKLAL
ncbi:MAG: response regulator transcription factor [Algicola sp.]|nr:response regulator transcription factor [Algicola sp.]